MSTESTMFEHANGTKIWRQNGMRHRLDGPAVERPDGTKTWYQNGKLHRLDGPAVERPDGAKAWYQNGKRHRLDGPAAERADGTKAWWQNGKLHRLDGPAVEYADGTKMWYRDGNLHRLDGPATERPDGTKEWWRWGIQHYPNDAAKRDGPRLETELMVVLSTAHISYDTAQWLADQAGSESDLAVADYECGFVLTPLSVCASEGADWVPDDLKKVAACVLLQGEFNTLKLDRDGPVFEPLPTFEW